LRKAAIPTLLHLIKQKRNNLSQKAIPVQFRAKGFRAMRNVPPDKKMILCTKNLCYIQLGSYFYIITFVEGLKLIKLTQSFSFDPGVRVSEESHLQ